MYIKLFNLAVSIVYLFSVIGGCDHNIVICDMDMSGSDVISATDFSSDHVPIIEDIAPTAETTIDPISVSDTTPPETEKETVPVATTTKSAEAKSTTTSTTTKKAGDSTTAKPTKAVTQPPVTQPPVTQAPSTSPPTTAASTTLAPTTQPPTTAAPTTAAPTTAAPSMSISDLSSSAKSYATSIGMTWDTSLNSSNSHWVTPLSSAGFSSVDAFKSKINERTSFLQSQGFTNINIYFEQSGNKILAYHFVG